MKREKNAPKLDDLSENVENLTAVALIWLFGVLVFLPIAEGIDPTRLPIPTSLMIFLALTFFLLRGLKRLGDFLDVASELLAKEWLRRRKEGWDLKKTKSRLRVLLEAATILAVYLLYSPLLTRIHPSINGIAIIITLLGILLTLFRFQQ